MNKRKIKRIVLYADNSAEIDGYDYAPGSEIVEYVMRKYGIPRERDHDSKHLERDGTRIRMFSTLKYNGGWSKSRKGYNYQQNQNLRKVILNERSNTKKARRYSIKGKYVDCSESFSAGSLRESGG